MLHCNCHVYESESYPFFKFLGQTRLIVYANTGNQTADCLIEAGDFSFYFSPAPHSFWLLNLFSI